MSDTDYPERYCAFVDILGFSTLIDDLGKGSITATKVQELLADFHSPVFGKRLQTPEDTDFRAQSISDAVAVSTRVTAGSLDHLFFALEMLSFRLLIEGY